MMYRSTLSFCNPTPLFSLTFVTLRSINCIYMKYINIITVFAFAAGLLSCEEDDRQRRVDTIRAEKHNDSILKIISNNWSFEVASPTPAVQQRIITWTEWNQLVTELKDKPKGGINAYKQKTKNLVDKANRVRQNLPAMFAKPQVYSRLGVLVTKIKDLYTYLNVDVIQDKKVLKLIAETRQEIISVQNQLDEIIRISQIPKEQGEEEMLRALDTTRMANPDRMMQPEQITPTPGMGMPDRNRTFTKP
jgi:hypothetical protein